MLNGDKKVVVILGALNDETMLIKKMLAKAGVRFVCAANDKGQVVKRAGDNYKAVKLAFANGISTDSDEYYFIHAGCRVKGVPVGFSIDPISYPDEEVLAAHCWASSILGQLAMELDGLSEGAFSSSCRTMLYSARMAVASQYCLSAAYSGKVPGVNPVAFRMWRSIQRARIQKKDAHSVLEDFESEAELLSSSDIVELSDELQVVCISEPLKEVVDAAAIAGVVVQYKNDKGGVKLINPSHDEVALWLDWAATAKDWVSEPYGSPQKRYAGGKAA